MPHQFNATLNHSAVAYLVWLHADIGGKILDSKKGRTPRRVHAGGEHVIKIFDPDDKVQAIATRRRQSTNPWFKRAPCSAKS